MTAVSASLIVRPPATASPLASTSRVMSYPKQSPPPERPCRTRPSRPRQVCLLRQILEEERVHRALEPDMKLADLAFGDGHDLHVTEGKLLEEASDMLL